MIFSPSIPLYSIVIRSFTTVSFLISLWSEVYSPFIIADELDVYMVCNFISIRSLSFDSILTNVLKTIMNFHVRFALSFFFVFADILIVSVGDGVTG